MSRANTSHVPSRIRLSHLPAAVALSIALAQIAAGEIKPAPWPTKEWPVVSPTMVGLDADRLDELVELIREGEEFPDLHGLLVIRKGYLVVEEYFDGYEADDLHTLQSVSKSFTSAVMGIAIEQEKIKSVDERVLDFFDDLDRIENIDDRKRAMRIEDLLTMRSGTDYHERGPGSPHFQLNALPRGWTEFILSRPMINDPGAQFQYDSGGVILMSSLIKARTGEHADMFMKEHLFKPLGIERFHWHKNREGHPHMGGGLNLTPRDMAKFGLLYLRKGRWENEQVVPEEWVETSIKRHVEFGPEARLSVGYGYLWWILKPDPAGEGKEDIYAAMGFRAQYIFIIPEHDIVVVITGGTQNGIDQRKPIEFLYSHILPAVDN